MLKIQNSPPHQTILFGVGIKKHFGGVKAVDGCNFEIEKGKITALIGPNGAGKSTVFNLISGILKTDSGKIIFNGKQINNFSPEKISNLGISRLFQQTKLFNNLTVKDNLLLALDNQDTKFWKNLICRNTPRRVLVEQKQIKEILELVGMSAKGVENKLARDLSYGQKRLIEIAMTILNPHTFLMLDEPVAGINPKLRQTIIEILKKLKADGETILLIEHDMNFTLNVSDWIIVMDEGKVIAEDKPDEIKNNPKVLEAYLGE